MLRAAVRITFASPRTAWLIARMLAWKGALSMLKHVVSLATLVRLVEPKRLGSADTPGQRRVEYALRRVGRVLGTGDCLERSLVTYRFLSRTGARPRLVIGFDRGDGGIEGHAWVTVDGRPVVESRESLARYVEVVAFSASAADSAT